MNKVIEVQFAAKKQKRMKATQYTRDIDGTQQLLEQAALQGMDP